MGNPSQNIGLMNTDIEPLPLVRFASSEEVTGLPPSSITVAIWGL